MKLMLWKEYDPITTDISSLTAVGSPNAQLLRIFVFIYGICMVLMVIGLIAKAFSEYHSMLRIGYVILMIMQLTSLFGYSFFPLTGDKTVMNFQNMMHIIVTFIVGFTTIASSFFISFGYLKQEKTKRLGKLTLVIYTIQALMFILSYYYTFLEDKCENVTVNIIA